jgi:hypothetical protein
MDGICDKPVIAQDTNHFRVAIDKDVNRVVPGTNLQTIFNQSSQVANLYKSMSMTEFLIKHSLTNSIHTHISSMTGLSYSMNIEGGKTQTRNFVSNDAHYFGRDVTLVSFSKYYRAVSACTFELTKQLKVMKKFDDSVIHISRDHGRNARADGAGSDDGGYTAHSTLLLNGKIKSPQMIGNIKGSGNSSGSWGVSAPLIDLGNRYVGLGNIATTVTNILGVESPSSNDQGLLKNEGGELVSIQRSVKNVA